MARHPLKSHNEIAIRNGGGERRFSPEEPYAKQSKDQQQSHLLQDSSEPACPSEDSTGHFAGAGITGTNLIAGCHVLSKRI